MRDCQRIFLTRAKKRMAATLDQHKKQQDSCRILQAFCRRMLVYHTSEGPCGKADFEIDGRNLSHRHGVIKAEVVSIETPGASGSREVQVYSSPRDLQRTLLYDDYWIAAGKSSLSATVGEWINLSSVSQSAPPNSIRSLPGFLFSEHDSTSNTTSHEYDMCVNPVSVSTVLKIAHGQGRTSDIIMASSHVSEHAGPNSKHDCCESVIIDVDVKTSPNRASTFGKYAGRASSFHDIGGLAHMIDEPTLETKDGRKTE